MLASAIIVTSSTILRRTLASEIRGKRLGKLTPSGVDRIFHREFRPDRYRQSRPRQPEQVSLRRNRRPARSGSSKSAACRRLGTDAVGALLILLNLLESQPKLFAELLLAPCRQNAATSADPRTDMLVDRVGAFFMLHVLSKGRAEQKGNFNLVSGTTTFNPLSAE